MREISCACANLHDAGAITDRIYRFDGPNPTFDAGRGCRRSSTQLMAQGYDHSDHCVAGRLRDRQECGAWRRLRFSRMRTDGTALPAQGPGEPLCAEALP